MVEIILRDDITGYEPKAFFGFTRRQIFFGALLVALAIGTFLGLNGLHLPLQAIGYVLMVEGVVVGTVGFGKVAGQHFEKYLSIAFEEFSMPKELGIETPMVEGAMEKRLKEVRRGLAKESKQKYRREDELG